MMKYDQPSQGQDNILSRREIEGMIADNNHIIILDHKVLRLDAWIKFHPGGDKVIKHMVGKDATDEVTALHSHEARQRMNAFQIGLIRERWINFLPPIQGGHFRPCNEDSTDGENQSDLEISSGESSHPPSPLFESDEDLFGLKWRRKTSTMAISVSASHLIVGTKPRAYVIDARTQEEIVLDQTKYPPLDAKHQDNIVQKYRALNERIHAAGLYNCNYFAYATEAFRYSVLFGLFIFFLNRSYFCLAAIFLGCFWHQLVFTAHDAGHMGITHDFQTDTVIGMIVADYLGGLSLGWWKRSHNVHHIVTNAPEHDPDIELMPFFALSHRFFGNLRSTYYDRVMAYDAVARFTVKYQHYTYYPILLFGRFNLYFLSWEHIYLGLGPRHGAGWWHRWFELAGQVFFWVWFGYGVCYLSIPGWWNRILFVLVSHMVTAPLHVQITLSHYAMSTADLGPHECFPQKMLRTTMDVNCPAWFDFFHGGLQFQAIHHLYPRIPRHNLRKTQKLVKRFCEDVQIPYTVFTFYSGNKEVICRLGDIAMQAKNWEEC
ncbi:fatty acid desaturase-domain-containing protein [Talaromyces proteolyticus]|uniref:Delta 8-(E)-sphingolipid desaturase n=1 Tax=Talaromyces proteolyticus TaxID=1131652 RepID=A0AAD4KPS5_9EURO|nr:fatty acid desaturase-domain-containing protein [Talaromyces proteolyticus]KAH8696505.1 fatty acid desaturase-domain-containing protein [Talaromyces proteolyticus]